MVLVKGNMGAKQRNAQAYLWPASTGLPGLRCASRTLAVVLIFGCRPGVEAAELRALEDEFAVAAVDMESWGARR